MLKGYESCGQRVDSGRLFPKMAAETLPLCMLFCLLAM